MDRDKIIGLFTPGKHTVEAGNKGILHDIITTYPYFQLAQVLYAREAYDDNDTNASGRVKVASAYAPNRKALYLLFKNKQDKKDEAQTGAKPLIVLPKEEITYNFVFQSATKEVVAKPETYVSDIAILTVPEEEKQNMKGPKESTLSETFLEREILGVASIAKTEKSLSEIPGVPEKEEERVIRAAKEEVKKVISANEVHSFDEWLKLLPGVDVKEQPEQSKDKTEKKVPKKAADIIQQFLINQPRISRPKAEFFSPSKAARQSIMEDDDLVSETLAKIYLQQGNPGKALKAYETLMLQNPQKKAYFAARIKEVRQLIESGNTKK